MAKPTPQDMGAAMMAWYAECVKRHPEGLVSQSQAATMLGVSRMAVSRLVSGGYLRAEYFPKPPDIEGLIVTEEYPAFLQMAERLGMAIGDAPKYDFPKACFVSFADVCRLWRSGDLQKKCRLNWSTLFDALFGSAAQIRARRIAADKINKIQSQKWHEEQERKERGEK